MRSAWVAGFVCVLGALAVLLCAGSALAQDVVHLRGGGVIRGDVMELIPNQYVNVRLADGTARRIEWAQVERVEEGSSAPATTPSATSSATSTTSSATSTTTPVEVPLGDVRPAHQALPAPSVTAGDPSRAARRVQLEQEIAAIQSDQRVLSNNSAPIMMGAGYVGLGLLLPAISLVAVGSICDECSGFRVAGLIIGGLSIAGIVIGIVGLAEHSSNASQRSENARQLYIREQELKTLSYDLQLGPAQAAGTLSIRW